MKLLKLGVVLVLLAVATIVVLANVNHANNNGYTAAKMVHLKPDVSFLMAMSVPKQGKYRSINTKKLK